MLDSTDMESWNWQKQALQQLSFLKGLGQKLNPYGRGRLGAYPDEESPACQQPDFGCDKRVWQSLGKYSESNGITYNYLKKDKVKLMK